MHRQQRGAAVKKSGGRERPDSTSETLNERGRGAEGHRGGESEDAAGGERGDALARDPARRHAAERAREIASASRRRPAASSSMRADSGRAPVMLMNPCTEPSAQTYSTSTPAAFIFAP